MRKYTRRMVVALAGVLTLGMTTSPLMAQVDRYYVELLGNPTTIWSQPSRSSPTLATFPAGSKVILESTDEIATDEGIFHEVMPLAGAGFSWELGYVHESEIRFGIRRPVQVSLGLYGSYATSTSEGVTLTTGSVSIPQPFGREGTASVLGLGLTVGFGRYIPVGRLGVWARVGGELDWLTAGNKIAGLDSSSFQMLRVEGGGDLIYRISSIVDLSVGATVGGGPLWNELTLSSNKRTYTAESWVGGIDLLAGFGFGRGVMGNAGLFRGGKIRFEGGYRFGFRLSEWSLKEGAYRSDAPSATIDLESIGEPLKLNGPIFRLVVGY